MSKDGVADKAQELSKTLADWADGTLGCEPDYIIPRIKQASDFILEQVRRIAEQRDEIIKINGDLLMAKIKIAEMEEEIEFLTEVCLCSAPVSLAWARADREKAEIKRRRADREKG